MKKALSVLLAGAVMAGALAGCGGPANQDSGNEPAVGTPTAAFKVGGTGPLTGEAAIYGNAVKNGAQIAVDEINAEGGIQFELNVQDDENDPEKAANAYNKLRDWGIQLSLVSVTSKPGEAISVNHNEDRIFGITPSASSVAVTEGKDNVYQMCFIDPNQGISAADYIADNQLGEKIAVIYKVDDVYSSGIYETFKSQSEVRGLNIVSTTSFTTASQNDFNVQLSDAKNAGADLVFLPMYYQPASLILNQAKTMGYDTKFIGVDGMDGILTLENFDTSLAEGVMLLTPFNPSSEDARTKSFVETYQSRYGEVPNQFAADAYDCIYAYKQALEASGATPDMSAEELCGLMIEQFGSMTFGGLTGTGATWDSATGRVSKTPTGVVIQNGAYVGM